MFEVKFLFLLATVGRTAVYGDDPLKFIPRYNNFLPTSCRDVVYPKADNPLKCAWVTRKEIGQEGLLELDKFKWATVDQLSGDTFTDEDETSGSGSGSGSGQAPNGVYNDLLMSVVADPEGLSGFPYGSGLPEGAKQNPTIAHADKTLNPDNLPGACRWDYQRSNLGLSACLCPATKKTCSHNRKECYWYQMPEEKATKLGNQGVVYIPTHACINSAERFYYLLAGLLKKRGKKDFAIKIRYGATPARGQLPLGPYGPAIIGGGAFSSEGLAKQTLAKNLLSRFSNPGWTPNHNPYSSQYPSPSHYPSPPQYPSPPRY